MNDVVGRLDNSTRVEFAEAVLAGVEQSFRGAEERRDMERARLLLGTNVGADIRHNYVYPLVEKGVDIQIHDNTLDKVKKVSDRCYVLPMVLSAGVDPCEPCFQIHLKVDLSTDVLTATLWDGDTIIKSLPPQANGLGRVGVEVIPVDKREIVLDLEDMLPLRSALLDMLPRWLERSSCSGVNFELRQSLLGGKQHPSPAGAGCVPQ